MTQEVDYAGLVAMLRGAAAEIRGSHEVLSQLDSVGGDGDHGTTMLRAMTVLEQAIEGTHSRSSAELLQNAGWAIMGVDGGATGPLFGTFFLSMAEAMEDSMDAGRLATAFEAALAGVQRQTKAQPGDKTLIDALVPAVQALREAADAGSGPADALQRAAEAAAAGSESTKEFQARFGRARNIREKSIGTPDPGATSVSLMIRGFAEALAGS